jgi:protein-disulfide isomerase
MAPRGAPNRDRPRGPIVRGVGADRTGALCRIERESVKVRAVPQVDDEQELTRKQRREQAREERRQAEQAAAASATRRTRMIQLGGAAAVVVVAIVVILVATGGSKSSGPVKKGSHQESALVGELKTLLGGIPESGATIGVPTAPVTIQYFGDLECPICKEFSLNAMKPLIERYVRPGKLRIEYRNLETATSEPETFRTQQMAALAAGKQNLFWYYLELFYHQQGEEHTGYVTEEFLRGLAQQVPGLNFSAWLAARSNPEFTTTLTSDAQAANNAGFTGTPSFLIGRTGGAFKKLEYESLTDPASFEKAIEAIAKA